MGRPFEYKGHILYPDDAEDGWAEVRAINAFEAEEDERVRRILESEKMRKYESQRRFEVDELSSDEKMLVKSTFEAYFKMSVNDLANKSKVAGSLLKKLGVI